MNVVFWSPVTGMSAVSSSMVAAALATALYHKKLCSVLQLQFDQNSTIPAFIKQKDVEELANLDSTGVDALIRIAKGGFVDKNEIRNVAISLANKNLNVFANSSQNIQSVYEKDLLETLPNIFTMLNNAYTINFIDAPSGINECSKLALNYADCITVCLPQNTRVVTDFFNNYRINKEKLIIVLGNSDSGGSVNVGGIQYTFRKNLKRGSVFNIPHCVEFMNAMNAGITTRFYAQQVNCDRMDVCYEFIQKSAKLSQFLLNNRIRR